MSEHDLPDLPDLLERTAERFPVGQPPIARMVAESARRRRRRTLLVGAASVAAAVSVVGGVTLLSPRAAPDDRAVDPVVPVSTPSPVVTPPGTRLVGVGRAAIAVPEDWGTNETRCGVPQRDTVVIDVATVETCLTPRPGGVDSVEISEGVPPFDFAADRSTTIDGVPAQRQDTACVPGHPRGTLCSGTVVLPTLGISFHAESSTGAAEVDRALGRIRVVSNLVGVPGFRVVDLDEQTGAQTAYVAALRAAGLVAEVRTRKVPAVPAGYVLAVDPAPGTMLRPGDVVTVTAVAAPEGPADEVSVGINSVDARDEYHDLSDAQIRAGATITLSVGDRIWAYAHGKRSRTLAGELDGTSIAVDGRKEGPNYPHSWLAVRPGRTRVTLTVTAGGRPVVLGTVTVLVR